MLAGLNDEPILKDMAKTKTIRTSWEVSITGSEAPVEDV